MLWNSNICAYIWFHIIKCDANKLLSGTECVFTYLYPNNLSVYICQIYDYFSCNHWWINFSLVDKIALWTILIQCDVYHCWPCKIFHAYVMSICRTQTGVYGMMSHLNLYNTCDGADYFMLHGMPIWVLSRWIFFLRNSNFICM